MNNEQEYNFAIWEAKIDSTDLKLWLQDYFDLYISVLIYPKELPPIPRSFLKDDPLRWEFYETYTNVLNQFDYKLDNENQTLELN